MKSIQFFDDFCIHRGANIERKFHTPRWLDAYSYRDPQFLYGMGYASVVRAPKGGFFLYYISVAGADASDRYGANVLCMAYSADGLFWEPFDTGVAPEGAPSYVLRGGYPKTAGCWVYHDVSKTAAHRYVMTDSPIKRAADGIGLDPVPSYILASDDGTSWSRIPGSEFLPDHSDTCNSIVFNPKAEVYQMTLRRRWGERRVFQIESKDLVEWSSPHPVVHPSTIDPPSTHLYGMPQFYIDSAGLFVGFLWRQHMPYNEVMGGPVTTEYAYSYDGSLWNRTHHTSMPRRELGEYGGGSLYGTALIEREDDMIIYAVARIEEHHAIHAVMETGRASAVLLPGLLRKHGFVGLVSSQGRGEITTECLLLDRSEISLNVNAPLSGVRAQLCDTGYKPIPGCTYADCTEISGDHTAVSLSWGDNRAFRKTVDEKRWVRLQITLEHAELFSIDTDCALAVNNHAPVERDL